MYRCVADTPLNLTALIMREIKAKGSTYYVFAWNAVQNVDTQDVVKECCSLT
jgi:hypothetical protein